MITDVIIEEFHTGLLYLYNILIIKTMNHEHNGETFALHLGFKIAKLALEAAAVAAAFCLMKEVHKVHRAIERKEERK